MSIRWWPHTRDPAVASYRLRCLRILEHLRHVGLDAGLFEPGEPAPSVLVLSKRYDPASLQQACDLRERHGTRLLLDLCDNHFYHQGNDPRLAERTEHLRAACAAADGVVVASQALKDVVRAECPQQARVNVIPDAAEPPCLPTGAARWRHPGAELRLRRFGTALARAGAVRARRLVWFGNHGSAGTEGGMGDLSAIRADLEHAHAEAPLSLSVISNHEEKFSALTSGWLLPCLYLPWHAATISRALRLHTVCVIPVGLNPFTRCKTNNRVATALLHGLNVVADRIPSYDEFEHCTVLDDWSLGLGGYLADQDRRDRDVRTGGELIAQRYSLDAVAAQWQAIVAPA